MFPLTMVLFVATVLGFVLLAPDAYRAPDEPYQPVEVGQTVASLEARARHLNQVHAASTALASLLLSSRRPDAADWASDRTRNRQIRVSSGGDVTLTTAIANNWIGSGLPRLANGQLVPEVEMMRSRYLWVAGRGGFVVTYPDSTQMDARLMERLGAVLSRQARHAAGIGQVRNGAIQYLTDFNEGCIETYGSDCPDRLGYISRPGVTLPAVNDMPNGTVVRISQVTPA